MLVTLDVCFPERVPVMWGGLACRLGIVAGVISGRSCGLSRSVGRPLLIEVDVDLRGWCVAPLAWSPLSHFALVSADVLRPEMPSVSPQGFRRAFGTVSAPRPCGWL